MTERKYLPTLSDLIDRVSIVQLKEILIPVYRQQYSEELKLILHDIDLILEQDQIIIDADFIRSVIILGIYNRLIWENESQARLGKDSGNNLKLSHSLNGIRNRAKNNIENKANGRKDLKIDCLAAEYTQWEPSWEKQKENIK